MMLHRNKTLHCFLFDKRVAIWQGTLSQRDRQTVYLLFAGPLFFKEVTLMKQEQQVHIQKSKDALSYYRQMQRLYAASWVVSRFFRTLVCKLWHEWSQPAMEASSMAASRCFIFMYFLLPHWEPATWRSRAQTSIRAELPSGKLPTTRVRRRISRFSLSMTLLVRIRVQCSLGKSQ